MPLDSQFVRDIAVTPIAADSITLMKRTMPNLKGVLSEVLLLTAAYTLNAVESGATVVFNAATGFTITLPAPVVGLTFEFLVGVTNTGTACKIITSGASIFLVGGVTAFVDATTPGANPGPKAFLFDGATHVACTMGGSDTTKGGIAGTRVQVRCVSATLWVITGTLLCAGTIATPAATS